MRSKASRSSTAPPRGEDRRIRRDATAAGASYGDPTYPASRPRTHPGHQIRDQRRCQSDTSDERYVGWIAQARTISPTAAHPRPPAPMWPRSHSPNASKTAPRPNWVAGNRACRGDTARRPRGRLTGCLPAPVPTCKAISVAPSTSTAASEPRGRRQRACDQVHPCQCDHRREVRHDLEADVAAPSRREGPTIR